ncbi:MAG: putative DNA-binding domain-containing protein [Alphaproteobacteria bacterium]|nr:putative DNA-binding domain-containing protein [Alphaproteobacteria bacterium]MCW5738955.1 putative DNA-binding domain-containing protein [Alphaproteobacteria bacterium]
MSALAALQAEFAAWMRGTPAPADALRARVLDTAKADRDTLLAVYRDAYALRLIEALTTDYPGLLAMAGPAEFDMMARAYIAAHPSTQPSVRWFGRDLADFLAATSPFSATPAAADMARFEWALGEAYDAADAEPLSFEQLAAAPPQAWESLRLSFVPSLRRLSLTHQAPQAFQHRDAVAPGELDVPAEEGAVDWLIWRPSAGADAQFRSMSPDEARALDTMRGGTTFPMMCAALAREAGAEEAAAERAAGLLRAWLDGGLIDDAAWD